MRFQWPTALRWLNRLLNLLLLCAFGAALVFLVTEKPATESLSGRPHVVDGDTVRLGGHSLRLIGLDAPEIDQTCKAADGTLWNCGQAARNRLVAHANSSEWTCDLAGHDRYGRDLATCRLDQPSVSDADPARTLVSEGLALANGRYADAETLARAGHLGVHAGTYLTPAQWRNGIRWTDEGEGKSLLDQFIAWLSGN